MLCSQQGKVAPSGARACPHICHLKAGLCLRGRSEPALKGHTQSCAQQSLFQPGRCHGTTESVSIHTLQTKQPQAKVLRAQVLQPRPPGWGQAAAGVGMMEAATAPMHAASQEQGWDRDDERGASMGPLLGLQPRKHPYSLNILLVGMGGKISPPRRCVAASRSSNTELPPLFVSPLAADAPEQVSHAPSF